MEVRYINPFIASLSATFRTMLECEVKRGQLMIKENTAPKFEISGIIGLSGKAVGTVVLSFSKEVAIQAASHMLMCENTEINDDVLDAVGELTNMVAGGAKTELSEYELMVSLPNVITGGDHEVRFPSDVSPICVPFATKWGLVSLEVGLSPVREPVALSRT
jgi:chemotaxis protein CheX